MTAPPTASRTPRQPWLVALSGTGGLIVVALLVLGLLAALAWGPRGLALDIGAPGDQLFVRAMHGDERAGGRTYRWSRATSQIVVPGLGGASDVQLTLSLQSGRSGDQDVPLTILVDGERAGVIQVGPTATQQLIVHRGAPDADQMVIELQTPTFRPPGDARDLGIIVDRVAVEPVAGATTTVVTAWAERWGRLVGLVGLLLATLARWRRWLPLVGSLAIAGATVATAAVFLRAWLLASWPWLVVGLAGLTLAVHLDRVSDRLPGLVQRLHTRWLPLTLLALLIATQITVMVGLARGIEWIGNADYADNAVVARNLISGRGYTVDYVAQFYTSYASITHPSDVWPLLQPTLIALAFWLFGVSTFAAKLPNVLAMAGLLAATYWLGSRLFGRLGGLVAAGLLAVDDWFFFNSLFPVNDVPFGLLVLLLVGLVDTLETTTGRPTPVQTVRYGLLGLVAGLLLVAKPSGLLILLGVAVWWLVYRRPSRTARAAWLGPALAVGLAGLVVSPLIGRNLLTFGAPFYSLQSFDAWVLKWEPPFENIYRLLPGDQLRAGRLLSVGTDRIVEAIAVQFRDFGRDLQTGRVIEVPLLVLAGIGLVGGGQVVRRPLGILAAGLLPYLLFIQIYWHYELRYFAFLIPWLTILAAGAGTLLLGQALSDSQAGGRRLATLAVLIGLLLVLPPRIENLTRESGRLLATHGDVVNARWLAENTPREAVIMTRYPWQISWHSERLTVMLPWATGDEILATARRYGAGYLLLDHLTDRSTRREALAPLYEGREALGFVKLKEFRNERNELVAVIYRIPATP